MTSSERKKTGKWSRKKLFLFSFVTILILFVLLEICARIAFFIQYEGLHTSVSIQGSPLQCSDTVLIYKNQPFYVDYDRRYQYNEDGMKSAVGDVFVPQKTQTDFWVLLTGASAMEGMGSNRNGAWIDITGIEDHPFNETIAYYLQEMLQTRMPGKKIKVFNAAASGYNVEQSRIRYLSLAKRIQPDWVISMDGANDATALAPGETAMGVAQKGWRSNPQFHSPLKLILPMTKSSALINALKQKLFHIKRRYRAENAKNRNFPERAFWVRTEARPIRVAANNPDRERAAKTFFAHVEAYDSLLDARQVPHLLLIQPYLYRRNLSLLETNEKAVSNYYRDRFQDSGRHQLFDQIYQHYSMPNSRRPAIVPMNAVHNWKGWVFVDYCHFTKEANRRIAREIGEYITSGGRLKPFQ